MTKIPLIKKDNKIFVELPTEFSSVSEIELFQLKEGYYLLSIPLQTKSNPVNNQQTNSTTAKINSVNIKSEIVLTQFEKEVLRKLLAVKFSDRIPSKILPIFNESEKKILLELEKKGHVNIFKGAKYKDGVYNIADGIYPIISAREIIIQSKPIQANEIANQANQNFEQNLKLHGYAILSDKNEARLASERLSGEIKSGNIIGLKGFDGKFYLCKRDFFHNNSDRIIKSLKDDLEATTIADLLKLDRDGCLVILRILAENGEIIERRKGIFAPA